MREEEAKKVITNSWNVGFDSLECKLKTTQVAYHVWTKEKFHEMHKRIEELMVELTIVRGWAERDEKPRLEEGVCTEIDDILFKEETCWM